jgi:nucleoside-diphosphate-sugar epimerase
MKIGILGAGGFVGSRAIEYLTLTGKAEVRGIVRRYSSLPRLARFAVDWRLADAYDEDQLAKAFEGCEVVLHSVAGRDAEVAAGARPAYRAAERAGVRRIVLLSSAAIYGFTPRPGAGVDDRLSLDGLGSYAQSKLRLENEFRKISTTGSVELAVLRPSIVVGPRAFWITDPARALLAGSVPLVEGGPGICNSLYVDNLIDAVLLASQAENAKGEIFDLGDDNCITWRETYRRLATLLGVPAAEIESIPYVAQRPQTMQERAKALRHSPALKGAALMTPDFLKLPLRRFLGMTRTVPLSWDLPGDKIAPSLSAELINLHVCQWRLSSEKARRLLGYRPAVSVDEGLRRSVAWLRYAGLAPRR